MTVAILSFDDQARFPTDIAYGSEGGPEFSTEVIELGNQSEQRNVNWEYPREKWNVAYGVKRAEQLDALNAFFMAMRGRATGFRFKNHADFEAVKSPIVPVPGSGASFQLAKVYSVGGSSLRRKISKPVSGTVHVFVGGEEVMSGWTVDATTGVLTFDGGSEPDSGVEVTASFAFDVPCRFDTDYLPQNFADYLARSCSVQIVGLKR